jgi:peroxiredoxin
MSETDMTTAADVDFVMRGRVCSEDVYHCHAALTVFVVPSALTPASKRKQLTRVINLVKDMPLQGVIMVSLVWSTVGSLFWKLEVKVEVENEKQK